MCDQKRETKVLIMNVESLKKEDDSPIEFKRYLAFDPKVNE